MYKFQDGEVLTAEKLNNFGTQITDEYKSEDKTHSNQINVDGTWYELSGSIAYPAGAWTTVTTNVFVRTIQIERPYTPPAGYGFNYFIANSTSYSFASTGSFAGDDKDAVRILQFSSNSQNAIKTIGWILVKIGDE